MRPDDTQSDSIYLEADEDLPVGLDPHLQELVLLLKEKGKLDGSIVTDPDGVAKAEVIARLRNSDEDVPGFEISRKIGDIATGTVAIGDVERVRTHPNVLSLKAATGLHRELVTSVAEVRCDAEHLRAEFPQLPNAPDGTGVVIGIVDYGCDYNHPNFLRADRSTRLLYLWDQRPGKGQRPKGFQYGREFDSKALNVALQQPDPYAALDYDLEARSHGTHVMDIAAGNGRGTGQAGIAPGADLIFVHVAADDVDEEESLGNSRRLLEAVDYIFEKAANRPCVVNLSLGTHGGPHDGTTPVEQGFERLLDHPNRAIVLSAGNSFDLGGHTHGEVKKGTKTILSWQIQDHDLTPNEMEIWYPGTQSLTVELITPSGQRLGPVSLGQTRKVMRNGKRQGRLVHRHRDPNNHDHQIDILLRPSLPSGTWQIELSTGSIEAVPFHAWIERDDNGLSRFAAAEATTQSTLGSICCGERTIAVGSYDARDPRRPLSSFSSAGPTRDGREKPEVSAPGEAIIAAAARRTDPTSKRGTSMAAPHVTGLIALLFQVARAANRSLSIDEIRDALMTSARQNPPNSLDDLQYGKGRISGVAALQALLKLVSSPQAINVPAPLSLPVPAAASPLEGRPPLNGDLALEAALKMLSGTVELLRSSMNQVEN